MGEIEKYDPKEEFLAAFAELRPDFFVPALYEKEEDQKVVAEMLRPARTRTAIFASIPMSCAAEKCIYADSCPLQQKKIAPKGFPCPLEMSMVAEFMSSLMEELSVPPDNLTEVCMVRDLVDLEVQYLRTSKRLAKEDFIQENVIGIDSEGTPILKKELHMAVEMQERIHKRKNDLRKQLLATRESKAKAGQSAVNDSSMIADVLDRIREIDSYQKKEAEKALGTYGFDAYIDSHIVDAEIIEDDN